MDGPRSVRLRALGTAALLVAILHALGIEADHFGSDLDFEVGDLDDDLLVS